ncbi:uncharacterized protein LOC129293469 isoform X1 [Prosopis cineraria]|uniref:uncharacterized protein LOC129293469 isoform X1 n=1 Tax=Prosopis cineraria TaxID=364024 RepID=UPI00241009D0|nr:uncharacterized protein LOC129293469 isoform X1 [Prosopis cineraria]
MTSPTSLPSNLSLSFLTSTSKLSSPIFVLPARINNGRRLKICARAAISSDRQGAYDPELRSVLELATDSELFELETILFGPSYFSPLLKSIPSGAEFDRAMIGVDLQEREDYIAALESRFLFLAADARSTLRGWRPSYRNVLLEVRKRLNVPCSNKLSTEDLEVEIFLHLLQDNSSEKSETSLDLGTTSDVQGGQLSQWKAQVLAAVKVGAGGFQSMILKGGGIFTFTKIYQLLARKLSGKVLSEAANYQIKKELMKKGGQLAIVNLESRAALLAARQVIGIDLVICSFKIL